MFKRFSGGGEQAWPLSKIVSALEAVYDKADEIGEDGPLRVYGVEDHGVNFVVAMMQTGPGTGMVTELGFLARFIGFPVDAGVIQGVNRNLHISVASMEGPDLFLMAGVQVTGAYDRGQFSLILEAWRRDLMVTLHGISGGDHAFADLFPAAKMEAAMRFASNTAPNADGAAPVDMLKRFLGSEDASKQFCDACGGRGKRGLIARTCNDCDGTGFAGAPQR